WTATGIGRHEFTLAAHAIAMGGHVRVGFEDNLYLSKGVLAKSNGELVAKVVRIAKELGREIATSDEAREILSLPPRK
ncbi:3-keto-5-aminohexanoate cleavage protein, partial [Porphyromonas sp. CAG:1061]